MTWHAARAVLTATLLGIAAPTLAAEAGTKEQAREHFARGAQLYEEGRYAEALAEFEEVNRLAPHPAVFFNLAHCHEKLGELAAALRSYQEYLRLEPGAPDREAVREAISALERHLADAGVQQLLVFSEPAGADVWVDGTPRGKTPFSAELAPGPHALSLRMEGRLTVSRDAALPRNRSLVLEIQLPEEPVPRSGPSLSPTLPAPAATPLPLQLSEGPPARAPGKGRLWTWVAAGTAAAALGAGIAYGISAKSARDSLIRSGALRTQADAQRDYDSAVSRQRTANVFFGVAGAAGAAGVGLFFLEGRF